MRTQTKRNLGWITEKEDKGMMQEKVIGIAGLGGVGGRYFLDLVRLGFKKFIISDPDVYETTNINRQMCAYTANVGKKKSIVLTARAKRINPDVNIRIIDSITETNVESFCEQCDIVLDCLDLFAMDIRRILHFTCWNSHVDFISTAPLGFGASIAIFKCTDDNSVMPARYFGFDQWDTDKLRLCKFLAGMSPACLHRTYFNQSAGSFNFEKRLAPSTVIGMEMAAALTVANVVKVLRKEKVKAVPYVHQVDAYRLKMKTTKRGKYNIFRRILLTKLMSVL
jgi:hypothetical protein